MASVARRLCGFAVVLILCAPAVLAQCPTNADSAAPVSPSDVNFAAGSNVQFTWTPSNVSGVTYDVIIGPNITSTTIACANQTGTSCSATINTAGQFFWGVKTKKNACAEI